MSFREQLSGCAQADHVRRRLLGCSGLAIVWVLACIVPVAQAAKPKPPTPKAVITAAIEIHNGVVGDMSKFAKQAQAAQGECVTVQQSSEPQWQQVEFAGKAIELIEKDDLKPYNQRLPGWVAALGQVKAKGKKSRNEKQEATSYLTDANHQHAQEFYEFGAIGASLQAHDCEGALTHLKKAAELGDAAGSAGPHAWGSEGLGLLAASKLLKITSPQPSETIQPYLHVGV